jgi:hypothetical protein
MQAATPGVLSGARADTRPYAGDKAVQDVAGVETIDPAELRLVTVRPGPIISVGTQLTARVTPALKRTRCASRVLNTI